MMFDVYDTYSSSEFFCACDSLLLMLMYFVGQSDTFRMFLFSSYFSHFTPLSCEKKKGEETDIFARSYTVPVVKYEKKIANTELVHGRMVT